MEELRITLSEEQMKQLRDAASRMGVDIEDIVRVSLDDLLSRPSEDFEKAAARVLEKNRDLYKRLA